jgi:hypothetical protein
MTRKIQQLTWNDVLDASKLKAGTHIETAIETAENARYNYLAFNGQIFFLRGDGAAHYTGLDIEED